MTLQQMMYFLKISELHSFSRAAEALLVSQPALTKSMRDLEEELGVTLLVRSSRGAVLSSEGEAFLLEAKELIMRYEQMMEKYQDTTLIPKSFAVSTQHYSFAVHAFVLLVKNQDAKKYQFAIRETMTRQVIHDVSSLRSQIGVLYLSGFNRPVITKLLKENRLSFTPLARCRAYIYIADDHPLANKASVSLADLEPYPCLSFEQGDDASYYFTEELYSTIIAGQFVKVNDRATMLNLMRGLHGYTICSGIIYGQLNGDGYAAVPIEDDSLREDYMEIGYILKQDLQPSALTKEYIDCLKVTLIQESEESGSITETF